MSMRERVDMHERLFALYQHAEQYADLLEASGNTEKAAQVRGARQDVALNRDLDRILEGTK